MRNLPALNVSAISCVSGHNGVTICPQQQREQHPTFWQPQIIEIHLLGLGELYSELVVIGTPPQLIQMDFNIIPAWICTSIVDFVVMESTGWKLIQ